MGTRASLDIWNTLGGLELNNVLELIEVVKWGQPKLLVQVEVEGVARTVMHFDKGEEQLAKRMCLDLRNWPIDQLDALKEKYIAMREDLPKGRKAEQPAPPPICEADTDDARSTKSAAG